MAALVYEERTMRALYQDKYGDLDTYHVGMVPVPEPGPCQALVRIHAASLSPIDIERGVGDLHSMRDQFPLIPGHDYAGKVEKLGGGICCGFEVGDRVYGDVMRCQKARKEGFLGTVCDYAVIDCDLLGKMPNGFKYAQVAGLPMVGMMAIECFEKVGLKKGDKLVVTNGADEFGVHAMQIAKELYKAGEIAATVKNEREKETAKLYGADRVVQCDKEDQGTALKGWADVVVDVSGEVDIEREMLKENGGHISLVQCGKENVKSFQLCPRAKMLDTLSELLVGGRLKPVIDKVYTLEEGIKAVKRVKDASRVGKVIVQMDDMLNNGN